METKSMQIIITDDSGSTAFVGRLDDPVGERKNQVSRPQGHRVAVENSRAVQTERHVGLPHDGHQLA
jgi:hypothetical protein